MEGVVEEEEKDVETWNMYFVCLLVYVVGWNGVSYYNYG